MLIISSKNLKLFIVIKISYLYLKGKQHI